MKHPFSYRLALFVAICALCGCAVAPVQIAENKTPQAIPLGARSKPIQFSKFVTKLSLGEQIGQFQYGWGCMPGSAIDWRGGRLNITNEELIDTFRKELESKNYSVVGDPYALFDDPAALKAEILVAGQVNKVDIKVCFPYSGSPNIDIGNTGTFKGGAFMRVTWQLYSRVTEKVIYETTTEGSFKTDETIRGGLPVVLRNAFAANVRNLLAAPGFRSKVIKNADSEPAPVPALESL
ncbi:MAG TPA: hypothetical protein VFK88_06140 [Gallionella sp.]|nr:hypothetical protein [Gallionella sp.]